MISVLVVLYLKGIYISMEYMHKLLFFARGAWGARGAWVAQGARGAWGARGLFIFETKGEGYSRNSHLPSGVTFCF